MSRRRARSGALQRRGFLILDGDVRQGLALLNEVGVATVAGALDALSTGVVYCELVCALQGLAQYDVAEEWTEAMERWCKTNAIGSLHGRCRVHRAEILRLRASCDEAEQGGARERARSCRSLSASRDGLASEPSSAGSGCARGPSGRRAGQARRCASSAGGIPQPGLALVRLAQGEVATASQSIRDSLERPMRVPSKERPPDTDLQRAPLLEAQVEIEIAAGHIDAARLAAAELAARGRSIREQGAGRRRDACAGESAAGRGRRGGWRRRLCFEAARLWNDVGAPYEEALARPDSRRSAALRRQRAPSGVMEHEAARVVLERIEDSRPRDAGPK